MLRMHTPGVIRSARSDSAGGDGVARLSLTKKIRGQNGFLQNRAYPRVALQLMRDAN